MERTPQKQHTQKKPPTLDQDLDLDDFSFKPITKGLGFHHKKETEVRNFRPSPRPRAYTPTQNLRTPFKEPIKKVKEEKVLLQADYRERILAFLIDLIVVLLVTSFTVFTLVYGADLNIQVLISILETHEIILFTFGIFSLYFLIYFSILDLTSTIGKSLMGLELKLENGKRPFLANSFPRALVTLLSLALLGLPLLSNFQNRLSESEIYKK
ncbi:MAG: hypothetical protein DRQ88_05195 [Epsilonproteobacteria bacterium]|nr:MAG: hypothetical protein DRQ89_04560 [Campylobacterota bacterium]RLA66824.1 MAG: hypothetical protein DRQ88_05195 [Campylobacterota bacterium]